MSMLSAIPRPHANDIDTEILDEDEFALLDEVLTQIERAAEVSAGPPTSPAHSSSSSRRSSVPSTVPEELLLSQESLCGLSDVSENLELKKEIKKEGGEDEYCSAAPLPEELVISQEEFDTLDAVLRDAESANTANDSDIEKQTVVKDEVKQEEEPGGVASRLRARKRPIRTPSPPRKRTRNTPPTPNTTPSTRHILSKRTASPTYQNDTQYPSALLTPSPSPPNNRKTSTIDPDRLQSVVRKLFQDDILDEISAPTSSQFELDSHQPPKSSNNNPQNLPLPENMTPITINRSPILCLWATVVAERIGYPWREAMSLGKGVQSMLCHSRSQSLTPSRARPTAPTLTSHTTLLTYFSHLTIPITPPHITPIRALDPKTLSPVDPTATHWYLLSSFGPRFEDAKRAFQIVASRMGVDEVRGRAWEVYVRVRPETGWGGRGEVDLR
ncbi:hypothetical protein HDV00_010032, partial [Rhizophlyctis rosea]